MSSNNSHESYAKGFVLGALFGSAVGAITALLFAPKSGSELRREIAEKSNEVYGDVYNRASDFAHHNRERVGRLVNEGKMKADELVQTTKEQASHLLYEAEGLIGEARERVNTAQAELKGNINRVRGAAHEAAEAFRSEMHNSGESVAENGTDAGKDSEEKSA